LGFPLELSGENILIILLIGLAVGLLPSALVERTSSSLVRDIACGIGGIVVAALLTLAWRDAALMNLWPNKPAKNESAALPPPFEPVVLPLAPLRPLMKPVVYRSREEICDALARATQVNDLPAHFFIRLLYQESNFRLAAISSTGAQGIAQFMPETASDRGLDNPFDALQAIPASARLLRDLYLKFGNLGLAAAAYNAGPRRIADWRANKGPLPQETQDYVKAITGWPAEAWTDAQTGSPALKLPRGAPCQEFAGLLAWNGPDEIPLPLPNPRVLEIAEQAKAAAQPAKPPATAAAKDAKEKSGTAAEVKDAKAVDLVEKPKTESKGEPKAEPKARSGNKP
jgi:uncharacterized membrane protein YeaQ/YmgE (transglycosylase-associated protein family)